MQFCLGYCTQWSVSIGRGGQNCSNKLTSLTFWYISTYPKRSLLQLVVRPLHSIFSLKTPILHMILWKTLIFQDYKSNLNLVRKEIYAYFWSNYIQKLPKILFVWIRDFVDGQCHPSFVLCMIKCCTFKVELRLSSVYFFSILNFAKLFKLSSNFQCL